MAQQFNPQGMNAQNIKLRYAVLVFIKGSTAPLVLYVQDYQELYDELAERMIQPNPVLIRKETEGCFVSNQIAALAIQEEQYM